MFLKLQSSSKILKRLCAFPLPQCWIGYFSGFSASKLFIIVAFENLPYSPNLKMVLPFFLLRKYSKRAQCWNEFTCMFNSHSRFYVTQWSAIRLCGGLSVGSHPSARNNHPWQSILVLISVAIKSVLRFQHAMLLLKNLSHSKNEYFDCPKKQNKTVVYWLRFASDLATRKAATSRLATRNLVYLWLL